MFRTPILGWISWPVVRACLCTLAISLTWNGTWRVPREGFRYGGLVYGLVLTLMLLVVAAPLTVLQLAVGQLSQQDAVGIWRAVPFFRGIGYVRLLISFVGAAYSMIYLALTVAYFLYTATHNIPFPDCTDLIEFEGEYINVISASECLSLTFMSPVNESPEYYIAIALTITVLWIASPFVFYSSVKLMKRIMYVLAPVILLLGVVIVSCLGDMTALASFVSKGDWQELTEPYVWTSAVVQALWSSQVAGGFLIVAGDSLFANTDVQWTSVAIIGANIMSSWFWLVFWFATTDGEDISSASILVHVYQASEQLDLTWPLLLYLTLIFSGIITMLVLLYPVYDRLRRIGGVKWRLVVFASSLIGAGVSLAILVGGLRVTALVEDLSVPLLVCFASVVEILALGFIYGWRHLVEDVEFLIGGVDLFKFWVWGWWVAPAVITPLITWWLTVLFITHPGESWKEIEEASAVLAAAVAASSILLVFAGIAVGRQEQYDIFEKLKASFQPSIYWGPRDPITHYYWLARREVIEQGNTPGTRYHRRELGQFSNRISFLTTSGSVHSKQTFSNDAKHRSNSDDWVYTVGRKEQIVLNRADKRKRSKSVDWDIPRVRFESTPSRNVLASEDNNNIVGFNYSARK